MGWLDTLDETARARVFAAMRAIDRESMAEMDRATKLTPPFGTVGIGAADFDHVLRAEAGFDLLRLIRAGATPDDALEGAKEAMAEYVRRFNGRGGRAYFSHPTEMHRSETSESGLLARHHSAICRAVHDGD